MKTLKEIKAMSTEEIRTRLHQLSNVLELSYGDDDWSEAYMEYSVYSDILDERYREENQAEFDAFYKEHIEGRSWKEIEPDAWECYSDWHKDMYGFRPHII